MALTQQAQLSFTIQDEIGVKAAMTEYVLVDPSMTVAQLHTLWSTQAGLIDLIVGGAIIHGKAEVLGAGLGTSGKPAAGSRVEQTGLFTFGNNVNSRAFGEDVPSLSDAVIVSGHIDLTDTNVQNFFNALITPVTLNAFTNNVFQELNALRQTAITFRKRRRLESRLTTEVG